MAEALDPGAAAERALALSREATSLRDAGRLDEAIARYREVDRQVVQHLEAAEQELAGGATVD